MNNTNTPEILRAEADAADAKAEESFNRCDTDGFLSQWASGIAADRLRLQAQILEQGGTSSFPALYDLEGNRVPAKLITVVDRFNYGRPKMIWALLDRNWKFTGVFLNRPSEGARSQANFRAKGYVEGTETAPAKAEVVGSGHGLSGNAWATIVRADRGCPAEAVEKG